MIFEEQVSDFNTMLQNIISAAISKIWTELPGEIIDFDAEKQTCSVQPLIRCSLPDGEGNLIDYDLPIIKDVPIEFPNGGGYSLTFPIQKGDECIISFACRCIDAWWQNGGIQNQVEKRMHDLSDAFVRIGPRSQANKLQSYSNNSVQLKKDENTIIDIKDGEITIKAGEITIKADNVKIESSNVVIGDNVTIDGKDFLSHTHNLPGTLQGTAPSGGGPVTFMPGDSGPVS